VNKVTILQVLEHYGFMSQLRRSGDCYMGPCPLHQGLDPAQFTVHVSTNRWHCSGRCKRGGTIVDVVRFMEGVNKRQAELLIEEAFGIHNTWSSTKAEL